ncbi:ATP-binding cassette domain-containing protein [Mycetocola sp.]|uniref:ATP-binding cassette domain-containing protein n=1 Tax=Mycetocola sp. TaxID=1871042 RepID=UPI003988E052
MAQQLSLTHEKCRVDPALPPRGKPRPFVLTVIAVGPHSHVLNVAGASVDIVSTSPRKTASAGIAFVPSQRPVEGLALTISASDNVSLPRIRRTGRLWFVGRSWQLEEFQTAVGMLSVTPSDPSLHVQSFSGGNQQKLLLAKWMFNAPRVLIAHEPTQAVDVGARDDILRALRSKADAGAAVLISSIETDDLARVCDRVLIMRAGTIVRELTGDDITSYSIITAVYDEPEQDANK